MIYLPGSADIVGYVMNLRRMLEKEYKMRVKDIFVEFHEGNLAYAVVLEVEPCNMPEIENVAFTW